LFAEYLHLENASCNKGLNRAEEASLLTAVWDTDQASAELITQKESFDTVLLLSLRFKCARTASRLDKLVLPQC